MAKCISILGSTGSIGVQTLDVARNLGLRVAGLAAGKSIDLLEKQAREFMPVAVALVDTRLAKELRKRLKDLDIEVLEGDKGLAEIASLEQADTVVAAIVGIAGLKPTMKAVEKGKNIAFANKEILVTAGPLFIDQIHSHGVKLLPVDSEHSAIFQCLEGNRRQDVSRIILTASGGPFRGMSFEQMKKVRLEDALKHPNWNMGSKITIDSATMMNKGLEVIEARWLFDIGKEKIDILVHPQSIVHSAVEYTDGAVIAQLGSPDMRIPIQYALTYPIRAVGNYSKLDLLKVGNLIFEEPDFDAFPCLGLAFQALEAGGTMPAVMNAANEEAVGLFLKKEIGFTDIPKVIGNIMEAHNTNMSPCLDDIIEVDRWAREKVYNQFNVGNTK